MQKIRYMFVVLGMLLSAAAYSAVQVSIGINLSSYPELVVVPGYPVYYAPGLGANFFFYDGLYWVYQDDNWYASSWYNGPWWFVAPEAVPLFVLRIPVRYYSQPPTFFLGWQSDAPPHWGDHWGRGWEQRRSGWDRWNHDGVPAAAPLPRYQKQYSGDRYPRQAEQQHDLQQKNYRYQPRDPEVQQHFQEQAAPKSPAPQEKQVRPEARDRKPSALTGIDRQMSGAAIQQEKPPQGRHQQEQQALPEIRNSRQQDIQRPTPLPQDHPAASREQMPQRGGEAMQRAIPATPQPGRQEVQMPRQQTPQSAGQREQPMPRSQVLEQRQQGKGEQNRGQDQERSRGGRNE